MSCISYTLLFLVRTLYLKAGGAEAENEGVRASLHPSQGKCCCLEGLGGLFWFGGCSVCEMGIIPTAVRARRACFGLGWREGTAERVSVMLGGCICVCVFYIGGC